MKYNVTFLVNYTVDDATDKWDAIEQAKTLFYNDTPFDYTIDVKPIHDKKED